MFSKQMGCVCRCSQLFTCNIIVLLNNILCAHCIHIHLAKLIPRWLLKPAVCKYPTTVNKSEINILLPKPYSVMWHLVRGNRVRNGRDRRPKHVKCVHQKLHFWKFLWTVCSTTQSIVESMITRMMSTEFFNTCRRNHLSSLSPLCLFNEYVHFRVVVLQRSAYRNFHKCKFWWTSFACFGLSIAAISYTIFTHEVSHSRARLWQPNVYFRIIHSCWIFAHSWL